VAQGGSGPWLTVWLTPPTPKKAGSLALEVVGQCDDFGGWLFGPYWSTGHLNLPATYQQLTSNLPATYQQKKGWQGTR
jgi:hypothetical protein